MNLSRLELLGDHTLKTFASHRGTGIGALAATLIFAAGVCFAGDKADTKANQSTFRGLLGSANSKIKREGNKTELWAGGARSGPGAKWYDFTGPPLPPEETPFGIGKDRIPSIDDPLFVSPDDSRLLKFGTSHYRKEEQAKTNAEINIIGFVQGGEARAYPIGLLDRHELVNDTIGGKPVVVGW